MENSVRIIDLEGRHFHDFCRTGVRNFIQTGVPEAVAMKISGHKSRSVFDRYNIVSHVDLVVANEKLTRYMEEKRKFEHDGYKTVTIEPVRESQELQPINI